MKVGIIGAGFTGLSAAKTLVDSGVEVDVFEKDTKPGGMAMGFKKPGWRWSIEAYYHHWFTGDKHIKKLADEINHNIIYVRPKTSTLKNSEIIQLDSPLTLLTFKKLPFIERVRTGLVMAYLKLTPFWKPLEKISAESFIRKFMGEASWRVLWEPLFISKFKKYKGKIPASWFWARIKTRSTSLGYPEGGYQSFTNSLVTYLEKTGRVKIFYNSEISKVESKDGKIILQVGANQKEYDAVICTLPFAVFAKICKGLPEDYKNKLLGFESIGAVNLLLSLNKQFFEDGSYWLNVNDDMPFLVVVEHTNFMDKKYYSGENLLYIGNYLDHSHNYFKYQINDIIKEFIPYLKKIRNGFDRSWIKDAFLFKSFYSQPIIPLNYSEIMPGFKTPIEGIYLANLQQTNPYDRGTEYAVANGEKVAKLIINSLKNKK